MSAPVGVARRVGRGVTGGRTAAMFGLYAGVVLAVLALASTGSGVAMVTAGLVLAAFVALLVWWSGATTCADSGDDPTERSM
jgi:hypothetical protein